jgi:hypothetical protein
MAAAAAAIHAEVMALVLGVQQAGSDSDEDIDDVFASKTEDVNIALHRIVPTLYPSDPEPDEPAYGIASTGIMAIVDENADMPRQQLVAKVLEFIKTNCGPQPHVGQAPQPQRRSAGGRGQPAHGHSEINMGTNAEVHAHDRAYGATSGRLRANPPLTEAQLEARASATAKGRAAGKAAGAPKETPEAQAKAAKLIRAAQLEAVSEHEAARVNTSFFGNTGVPKANSRDVLGTTFTNRNAIKYLQPPPKPLPTLLPI